MSQPQTQAAAKVVEPVPCPRIMRVDLLEVLSVADATASSFGADAGPLGAAKSANGFRIEPARMGADGLPVLLKAGETWDGLKLSKVLTDRIRNVRVTHVAFVPKENVRGVVYSAE